MAAANHWRSYLGIALMCMALSACDDDSKSPDITGQSCDPACSDTQECIEGVCKDKPDQGLKCGDAFCKDNQECDEATNTCKDKGNPDEVKCGDVVCKDDEECDVQSYTCKPKGGGDDTPKCGGIVCTEKQKCVDDVCKDLCGSDVCADGEKFVNDTCQTPVNP